MHCSHTCDPGISILICGILHDDRHGRTLAKIRVIALRPVIDAGLVEIL